MARIISIINYKGGVGKTTITLQLAVGLATLMKQRVLMVDLDPQCSLSLSTVDEHYWADWLERRGSINNLVQSFFETEQPQLDRSWIIENALDRAWDSMPGNTPGLDLLPSHLDLPEYEMRLVSRKPRHIASMEEFYFKRTTILKEALAPIRRHYDYILFDCPPNIYLISGNAIVASDYYLVPTIPDFISCYGIPFILQHIGNMQKDTKERGLRSTASFLGIVRNRVRQAGGHLVREHEEQSHKLKLNYENLLFETMIFDRIGVAELLGTRHNIYNSREERLAETRKEFTALTREMVRRIEEPRA
ncbi:MAG: AAA family ATPase [Spirochaetales bacterium]|nr:AAA family ATPase [Leptospiraceae bacterium]MCP5479860.1 AAA family ATPase [Spirochaetales bacterium]MCP5486250.1 AAA family ATPase [Spirochaetales bacterium]